MKKPAMAISKEMIPSTMNNHCHLLDSEPIDQFVHGNDY